MKKKGRKANFSRAIFFVFFNSKEFLAKKKNKLKQM
jgi:hypothetical protein